MRIQSVLLVSLLVATPCWGQDGRLGDLVRPLGQSIELRTDPDVAGYSGSTLIALRVEKATSTLRLNALELTVTRAVLEGGGRSIPLAVTAESPRVVLNSKAPLPVGEYRLKLRFAAQYNRHSVGLYQFHDGGRNYLSTQFEMAEARRCFPCFDEPHFKIPFQLSVAAPSNQRVYSNSPELKAEVKGKWTTHRFAKMPPMPSYLVALAVGPYQDVLVRGMSVPGRIIAPQGKIGLAGYARAQTPEIVGALERYFGMPYAYAKLDQIAISEFPYGAMENAGLVTYKEEILLVNEKTAGQESKTLTVMVIAHELSHQWFGNLVTMKWWNDLWLNEAFASWMATKVVNQLHPEFEYFLETPQNNVMTMDANLSTKPIRKPIRSEADIMDGLGLAYNKGEATLNMVERWLGEEPFQQGIRAYLREHRFGNAEAADLWSALGKASGKDVEAVLRGFTEQSGYPLLRVEAKGKSLTITQQRFAAAGVQAPAQTWTLPVFVRYGKGQQVATRTVLLDSASTTVDLDFEPDWVFPDDGAVGYYRWQVKDLGALPNQLSSREKLAFLANLKGLYQAGLLTAGERLSEVEPLVGDAHPAVVASALVELESMAMLFVDEHNLGMWRGYVQRLLAPLVKRYGLRPRQGEHAKVEELRPILLVLLARYGGDADVLRVAREQSNAYLAGSADVEPSLAKVYLQIALREADVSMVAVVKDALVAARDPERRSILLGALGMFGQAPAQSKALDLILDEAVTPSDLRTLLGGNSLEEPRRLRLQGWLLANFPALRAKIPAPFLSSVLSSLAGARDQQSLAAIVDYFGKQPDPDGVLQRELEKLKERVEARIADRERGQKSFDEALVGR